MEKALETKRIYTKRTPTERQERLKARLEVLKAAHATRAALIERLEKQYSQHPAQV